MCLCVCVNLWRFSVSPGGQLKALKVELKQLGNNVIGFMMSTTGQINTEKKLFFALFFLSNGSSHISGRPHLRPVIKKKFQLPKTQEKQLILKGPFPTLETKQKKYAKLSMKH